MVGGGLFPAISVLRERSRAEPHGRCRPGEKAASPTESKCGWESGQTTTNLVGTEPQI